MGSIASGGRSRWWLALAAVLGTTAASGQPAEAVPSVIAISVETHRPLAALATELETRYHIIVTYEEGLWMSPDTEDVTQRIIDSGKPKPPIPVIVPRKAAVSFQYALDPVNGSATADILSALLDQYHAANAPGRFRLEGSNGLYHLIPSGLKDPSGYWNDVSPVLSIPVSLADEERTVDDTLDEIVAQLNRASPVKIGWGFTPLNLFNQTRIRLAADNVPARQLMRRILEHLLRQNLPRRVTWHLNYDPEILNKYILNFLFLAEAKVSDGQPKHEARIEQRPK